MLDFLLALFSIVIIDLVLSGDNAMVIALASRKLPDEQRKRAVYYGTLGAVGIRIVLTVLAVFLLKIPFLQMVGGLFLLWVAVKLLIDHNGEEDVNVKEGNTFGQAIRTIIVADVILSLDNIFGVAAAGNGHLLLVILGLIISIPMMIFGSTVILKLINRFPLLIWVGAGILGWTAGSMIIEDKIVDHFVDIEMLNWLIPLVTTIVVIGLGKWLQDRQKHNSVELSN